MSKRDIPIRRPLWFYNGAKMPEISDRKKNYLYLALIFFILLLVIFDSYYWANITPWKEDEATNLWIASFIPFKTMWLGLLNSQKVPNPNGVPLLGILFRNFESMHSISWLLGVFQGILTLFFVWLISPGKKLATLLILVTLSFIPIRSISVSFVNQHLLTSVHLIFLILITLYCRTHRLFFAFLALSMAWLPFGLYLAGLPSSAVYVILVLTCVLISPPNRTSKFELVSGATILIFFSLFSILTTWVPYFSNVDFARFSNQTRPALIYGQGYRFLEQILLFPFSLIVNSYDSKFGAIPFNAAAILSHKTQLLGEFLNVVYRFQATLFSSLLIYWVFKKKSNLLAWLRLNFKWKFEFFKKTLLEVRAKEFLKKPMTTYFFLILGFTLLTAGLTPVFGGFRWTSGWRPDLMAEFNPVYVILMFMGPYVLLVNENISKISQRITSGVALIWIITQGYTGVLIINDHLNYKGDVIFPAEVPLVFKEQIVKKIVEDWRSIAPNEKKIPIVYNIDGDYWQFITEFGKSYPKEYQYPYTVGRAFDYILKRNYNLDNAFEGQQDRPAQQGRYLITFINKQRPQREGHEVIDQIFERYRLSIYIPTK
jgi:hypothetical protein